MLTQGDILSGVPHLFLTGELTEVRNNTFPGGQPGLKRYRYIAKPTQDEQDAGLVPPGGYRIATPEGAPVVANGQFSNAIMLTYGCDIDHNPRHRMVALVRPLAQINDEGQRNRIRNNSNLYSFHLPAYSEGLEESFVDLRRITSMHPDAVDRCRRVVSLSDTGIAAFFTQFFRFLTRQVVSPVIPAQR